MLRGVVCRGEWDRTGGRAKAGNQMGLIEEFEPESGPGIDPEILVAQMLEDPTILQQVTRTCREGVETLVGYFRCPLDAGQQRAVLHVPIEPVMAGSPAVEALVLEVEGRVRATTCHPFGVRLEVVLDRPLEQAGSVVVEVVASHPVGNG